MRYIKTNEELFGKSEIPRDIIDDIVRSIRSKYESVTVSNAPDVDRGIYDRVTITTKTPIGNIDLAITLRKPDNLNKVKIVSKIKKALSDYSVDVVFYYNKRWESRNTFTLKKFKDIDVSSVVNSIDWIVTKNTMMDKEKKETEKFYAEITISDIKDMLGDLYDILGEYEITKTTVKGNRGYIIKFNDPVGKSISDISIPGLGSGQKYIKPTDRLSKVLSELDVLNKRLEDVYKLTSLFDIRNSTGTIVIVIYQEKNKK